MLEVITSINLYVSFKIKNNRNAKCSIMVHQNVLCFTSFHMFLRATCMWIEGKTQWNKSGIICSSVRKLVCLAVQAGPKIHLSVFGLVLKQAEFQTEIHPRSKWRNAFFIEQGTLKINLRNLVWIISTVAILLYMHYCAPQKRRLIILALSNLSATSMQLFPLWLAYLFNAIEAF